MAERDKQNRSQDTTKQQQADQSIPNQEIANERRFETQGIDVGYSFRGYHESDGDQDQNDIGDAFGDEVANEDGPNNDDDDFVQDQFGDLDDNNPATNLGDAEPPKTNAGVDPDPNDLYGLEEPLAKPGDKNDTLRHRDEEGTPISMDQLGDQQ